MKTPLLWEYEATKASHNTWACVLGLSSGRDVAGWSYTERLKVSRHPCFWAKRFILSSCQRGFKMLLSWGFPGGSVVKNLPANAGSVSSSLIWEDPVCRGAAMPVSHNYWSGAQEPRTCNSRDPAATAEARALASPCSATRDATTVRQPKINT